MNAQIKKYSQNALMIGAIGSAIGVLALPVLLPTLDRLKERRDADYRRALASRSSHQNIAPGLLGKLTFNENAYVNGLTITNANFNASNATVSFRYNHVEAMTLPVDPKFSGQNWILSSEREEKILGHVPSIGKSRSYAIRSSLPEDLTIIISYGNNASSPIEITHNALRLLSSGPSGKN